MDVAKYSSMDHFRFLTVLLVLCFGIYSADGQCSIQNCLSCQASSTSCAQCASGYFPSFASCVPCSKGCVSVTSGPSCNGTSGSGICVNGCQSGWVGERCDRCDSNYYTAGGDCYKCSDNCVRSCDGMNGNCFGGCRQFYWGTRCENTCSPFCQSRECYSTNGTCTLGCNQGFYGNECEKPCGACSCDRVTGNCTGACMTGWYGEQCDKRCQTSCFNNECERITGHCTSDCPTGYFGPFCSKNCSSGCLEGCNRDTGVCSTGCKDGFHGDFCNNPCNENCEPKLCNRVTGHCVEGCKTGSYGDLCNLPCASSCREGCERESGRCSGSESLVSSENKNLPLIVGLSSGGGFLLIIIIATVICMHQLRSRQRLEKQLAIRHFQENNGWTFDDERISGSQFDKMSAFNGSMHGSMHGSIHGSQFHGDTRHSEINYPYEEGYHNASSSGGDIKLNDLYQYVSRLRASKGTYETEHKRLPIGLIKPCTEGSKPENERKNRYKNIIAYDHSRVILLGGDHSTSDYINANYINGYSKEKRYIAAQGPSENTVGAFWQMVWQEQCSLIVMLTNLVECGVSKCHPYWPQDDNECCFDDLTIKCKSEDVFADFTLRYLTVTKNGEKMDITHCQYTTWPDKGVPKYATPLIEFLHKVKQLEDNSPILVHCSAGCGRSGSFIAVHYLYEEAEKERKINFFNCVKSMRQERVNMVQTPEQYQFIHECILGALVFARSIVKADRFREYYINMMTIVNGSAVRKLEQQFMRVKWIHDSVDNNDSAHLPENLPKKRTEIVANDSCRVFLWSSVQGCNDYINAIHIPNFRQRYAYIVTEMPQVHTLIDFCRLLQQEECRTIVMLNDDVTETQDGKYWAAPGESVVCGPFRLAVKTVSEEEHVICRTIELHYSIGSDRDSINLVDVEGVTEIRQYQIKSWPDTKSIPNSEFSILKVIKEVQSWQNETGDHPITVHCRNGAERSGLFCLCAVAIDRVNSDGYAAMPLILNNLRSRRKELVPYFVQYKFCHDVLERWISQMKEKT
uniref:protein-tyrosine-phosphatase n=1 Tax=Crassostrea virginica TaxID=6565 RepID=A0A8B8C719_CRAVI|nr:receptor-type tyrosine-protein phosphatase epsilon-like isoform X5 [Crassostrea virginica]